MINIEIPTVFFKRNVVEHHVALGNKILFNSLCYDSFSLFALP